MGLVGAGGGGCWRAANSACHLFFIAVSLYLSVFPFDVKSLMWI